MMFVIEGRTFVLLLAILSVFNVETSANEFDDGKCKSVVNKPNYITIAHNYNV